MREEGFVAPNGGEVSGVAKTILSLCSLLHRVKRAANFVEKSIPILSLCLLHSRERQSAVFVKNSSARVGCGHRLPEITSGCTAGIGPCSQTP